MRVRLDENHRLQTDQYNYIIQKRSVIQNKKSENFGKEFWTSLYWCRDLDQVADKLVELKVKNSVITDLRQIHHVLQNYKEEIACILKENTLYDDN